ncbi:MAG: tetratricopeptide repeat protein [Myxococcota bacterium]
MLRFVLLTALLAASLPAAAQDLATLESAARANRRDVAAQTAYGRALIRAERYRDAERVLRNAARVAGDTPEALFEVARVAFAQENYRKSRAACRALERGHRGHVLTHVCRARAFLVWNRSGRAFEELEAAVQAQGDHFEAHLALGDAHRLRAATSESETSYRAAIAADATRAEPHYGLGLLYSNARRTDDAVGAFRAALRLDPADPDTQYQIAIRVGGDEARRLLTSAVAARTGWPEAMVALAELEVDSDRAAARGHYEAALEQAPNNAAAHIGLGRILIAEGEAEEGEASLRRALEIVPNSPDVALALGELYESQERYQDAFGQYRQAATLSPSDPVGLLRGAALALRLRRDVLATGFLDRYLQGKPNSARALELYGDAMMARRDRNGARGYYERALRGQGEIDRAEVQRKLRESQQQTQRRQVGRATR